MRTIFILIFGSTSLFACHLKAEQTAQKVSKKISSNPADTVNFKTEIQPLLVKNCSPCHFPGGKMYEKLPFDKGETIVSHEKGVFKRIKKDDEVKLVQRYIEENKSQL